MNIVRAPRRVVVVGAVVVGAVVVVSAVHGAARDEIVSRVDNVIKPRGRVVAVAVAVAVVVVVAVAAMSPSSSPPSLFSVSG